MLKTLEKPPPRLRLVFAVALLAAFLVRVLGLTRFDLGTDEAYSFLAAVAPDGIAQLQSDTNPPLYFLLLKAWMGLFGSSLWAMRFLSLVCSLAGVAALGGLARRCGAARRTTCWALLLAGLTPLQVHYAQQARGYALACLLVILGLWTFVAAVESGRPRAWALHGLVVALGVYTHNLLAPFAAGYVLAAPFLALTRRQWRAMAITYLAAVVLAAPGLWLIQHQAQTSGGTAWLRAYWEMTPPALAVPKSLEVLGLGGNQPGYDLLLPLPRVVQLLAVTLCALAAAACFYPARRTGGPIAEPVDMRRYRPLFMVCTFWPLGFLWMYSAWRTPIYLVGRYDLFAQPGYLLLLAMGFSRLQIAFCRLYAWLLPLLVTGVLAAGVGGIWAYPLDPRLFHHLARSDYLAATRRPGEPILCTGLEAGPLLYYLERHHLSAPLATFPCGTLSHLGWLAGDEAIAARQSAWPAEALAALNAAAADGQARIWIVLDNAVWDPPSADFAPSPRQQLSWLLLQTAFDHGWRRAETDPARQSAEANLRLISLTRDPPPRSPPAHAHAQARGSVSSS